MQHSLTDNSLHVHAALQSFGGGVVVGVGALLYVGPG